MQQQQWSAQVKGYRGSEQDETQFITKKNGAFSSFNPSHLKANVLFCRVFFNLTRFWTKLRYLVSNINYYTRSLHIRNLHIETWFKTCR